MTTTSSPAGLPRSFLTAGLSAHQVEFWAQVEHGLAQAFPLPVRTTDAPLALWLAVVRAAYRDSHRAAEPLVAGGMALADVVGFARVDGADPHELLVFTDVRLMDALADLAASAEVDLGVRDALGWVLVHTAACPQDEPDAPVATRVDLVQAWASVGLGQEGWVYAAAGLAPAEATAGIATGVLDAGQAQVMAALRGAVLPVG